MKVWISKYALTQGIYEADVRQGASDGHVVGNGMFENYHGDGKEWHRTKAGAILRAEVVRLTKISSLQKSISKLEKLKFE